VRKCPEVTLDRQIRKVIGMVSDLPRSAEAGLDLEMDYRTGDPVLDSVRFEGPDQPAAFRRAGSASCEAGPIVVARYAPFGSRAGLASGRLAVCRKSP
jgi:hypothetical protein